MEADDFDRIIMIAGDTLITVDTLSYFCNEVNSLDSAAMMKCEFEIGEANKVLGILYEEGYSKSNIYNGVWT